VRNGMGYSPQKGSTETLSIYKATVIKGVFAWLQLVHQLLITIMIRGGSPLPWGFLVSPLLAAATPIRLE
jgi:hypothetical protein